MAHTCQDFWEMVWHNHVSIFFYFTDFAVIFSVFIKIIYIL